MIAENLQGVAESVIRRAQRQGFITPEGVREELAEAGLSDALWKEVVALARPSLRRRQGRYYYAGPISARMRQEQTQKRDIHRAVRELLAQHSAAEGRVERRGEGRIEFVQEVEVVAEDGQTIRLVTRDLSATGIRLVGTQRLLGQKVKVHIPRLDHAAPWTFLVRILWTCAVGNALFENGGAFLEVIAGE
jgi:hypothetical protein